MLQRLPLLFGLLMFGFISVQSFGQSTVFFPPNTSNPLCNGSSNGSIVFDIQGDSTEFFFNWSGGNLPTNGNPADGLGIRRQTGLNAGNYSIFILDLASGLDTTVEVILSNPPILSVNGGNDFSTCFGSALTLNATTNAALGSTIRWSYTNGNGPQTLTGRSVTIPAPPSPLAITTATDFNILLTDPNSCTATDVVRVTVNPVPVGSANPSAPNICSGPLSVALSSNLPNTTFIWSVIQSGTTGASGGSGTAINQNVRTTGTAQGTATYTVRPTASGCFGAPFQVVATVKPKPTVSSLPDSTQICSGSQTNFVLSSNENSATFGWRFIANGASGASNGSGNLIQQTLNSGSVLGKVLYLIAAQANGCVSDTIQVTALVKPRPTISVTPADTINVCSGNIGTFNYGTSPNGALVSWTVGSNTVGAVSGTGNVNAQTYTNTSTLTQRATFSVVSSLNGCSSAVRQTRVRVRPVPTVSFAVLKDTVCTGSAINITLSSSLPGSNTFNWTSTAIGASGNTSPGTGASINNILIATGAAVGSVTYRAIATKESCPGPAATKTVFVNPAPSVIVSPTRSTICSGQNAVIGISSQVSGTNFTWTINAGTITGASAGTGNQINQALVNPGSGVDSVTYSIVPSLGSCLGNATKSVVLVRGKSLPLVDNTNPVICSGGRVLINITSLGSFSWLVSGTGVSGAVGGTGATINQILTLTGPADANLTYKIFGLVSGCISDTLFVPVTVNRNPVLTLVSPIDSICPGQNAQIQNVSNPADNANISWTAVSTNVTGASDGTGSTIDQSLNLVSGTIGKAKYNVSVSRFGCVRTASDSIFVRIPTIPFVATPSSTILCTGNTVQIALSSIQNNVTFAWTVSSSGVSGASAGTGNLINQTLSLNGQGTGFVDYIITPSSGGCVGLPQTVRINVQTSPAKPTITVSGGTSPICPGNSLTLTSNQLFGNQWTFNGNPIAIPIGNQRTLIASDSGLYRVVFTQSAGCVATSDPFRIQFFASPAVPVITGNPGFCPGGSSRLRSSNLTGNQWQINGADITGATDSVLVASIGGDYTLRTTLATCPVTSVIFTVTAFPAPFQPDISGNNFLCAGDSGILSSTSAATYQWIFNTVSIANQTSQTLKIKQGGNYQVRISDINTCSATSNIFNVQGIPANPTPVISGTLNFCPGDSTILTTNNVNPAWKNQWYRNGVLLVNDTLRTLVVKLAGTYTVTLKSPRGCVSTSLPSIVTERPVPATPVISGLSLLCPGGSVLLTSSSATGNVWFLNGSQINGANDITFSAQTIGNYSVTVTNEQGCKATSVDFVINPTSDITSTATIADPTSCGSPSGSIQVSTSGGSGQFDYVWTPATGGIVQGQKDQTAVSAGNYSVLVTDRLSGCSQLISGIVLNDLASFSATAQVTNVTSCTNPNGRINLTITGSNGPFTFVWTGPVGGTSQNLTNIPAGLYSVAINETNSNCTFILDSIAVNSILPPKPDIIASGPLEFCTGDSIVLKTTSAGPYQWARVGAALAGQTFDSLVVKTSGLYYVRVANPGFPNCFSRSDTLNIIANPLPGNPNINASNSAVCQGISVSLSTTSNLTKQWTLNGTDIQGATSSFIEVTEGGTYCLKVTDGNGCSRVSTTCRTITINPIPPAAVITGNPGFCPGGSTVLTAIPFDSTLYNYTWLRNNNFVGNSNRSQITVSLAGWYKIRVLNEATQCRTFGDSVFITNFNSPPAPTISGSSSICSGSSAILVSSQAATYQWLLNGIAITGANNDSLTITQAGAYSVAITDFNNCGSTSSSFAVSEIASPTASTITGNATFCAGSSSILTASTNANYQWLFNGSPLLGQTGQTISADLFGDYSVLVSNTIGCRDTSLVFTTIQGTASFTVDTSIIGTSCQNGLPQTNGQINVTTNGGSGTFLFEWTPALPPTPTQSNLSAGTYAVLVTDQTSGCEINLQNLVVTPTPTLAIISTITNDNSCILDNGSVTVNVSGGSGNYTFTWTSLASTTNSISDLGAGNYEVFVTDVASGCVQAFDSLTVLGVDTFTTSANVTQATSCIGFGLIAVSNNGGSGNFNYTWSGTGTGIVTNQAIQPNLTAGSYRVIVQDDGSKCIRIIDDMVLNPVNNLNINIQASNPNTCGANDGTASADIGVSGGTYLWKQLSGGSFNSTDSAVSGLNAGVYRVKVNVGTCADSAEVTLVQPTDFQVTAQIDSTSGCNRDGAIRVSVQGLGGLIKYKWFDGTNFLQQLSDTSANIDSLRNGFYTLIVGNESCIDTIRFLVPVKLEDTMSITVIPPSTCGGKDGKLKSFCFGPPGPPPDFPIILWQDFNGKNLGCKVDTAKAGTYFLVVDAGLSCGSIQQVDLPDGVGLGLTSVADSTDCNDANGTASISATGNVTGATYTWTKNGNTTFSATGSSQSNLSSGTYKVLVINNSCRDSILVVVPKKINCPTLVCSLSVSATKTDPTACGLSNGQANATINNGTNPTISWRRLPSATVIGTSANLPNLGTGTFQVIVTEGLCADTAQVTLTAPGAFTISTLQTPATCADNDGSINLTITGAGSGVSIRWTKIGTPLFTSTSEDISSLSAGTYKVVVTDGACKDSVETIVTKPTNCNPCILSVSASKTDPTACGLSNGQANATITNGTNPTISWRRLPSATEIGTSANLPNLGTGTYQVIVTEGLCADTAQVTLTAPGAFTISTLQTPATCADNDGAINLTITGAGSGVSIRWTKIGTPLFTSTSEDISNLSAGTYKVVVTDGPCKDSVETIVTKPSNCGGCTLTIAAIQDSATCADNDGSINLTVNGASTAVQFTWTKIGTPSFNANSEDISNLSSGVYKILVRDGSCKDSTFVVVLKPGNCATCNLSLAAVQDSATCADNDGSINLTVNGASAAVQFTWTKIGTPAFSANSQNISNLSSGVYKILVRDGNCKDSTFVVVLKPSNCSGCNLSIAATPDSASCADNDGSITLNVTGASINAQYKWSKIGTPAFTANTQNISNLSAGVYKVVISDGPCKDSTLILISKPANCGPCNLQVVASSTPVSCAGVSNGTAFAFITSGGVGPFTYNLNGTQEQTLSDFLATFSDQPAGPFSVAVKDETTLCTDTVEGIIGAQLALSASAFTQNPGCGSSNGSIRVVVSGGTGPYTFTIGAQSLTTNDGDTVFTGLAAGTYSVAIDNSLGCATSVSDIVLVQPQPVALTFGTIKPASCKQNADGSIKVTTISGASTFTYFIPSVTTGFQAISPGDTIKNLPAGTYQMTIRGISACDLETSFTIPGPAKVVLTASALSNSACLDSTGTARLTTLTGGNGAPWNFKLFLDNTQFSSGGLPSDSIFRDLAAGNYAMVVSDSNDCQDTARFSIQTQTVNPLVSITADKLQICSGDTVNFSASNLANITSPQYAWYLNGKPLNINTVSFKIDSLKNGDSVQVKLSGLPLCLNPDSVWSSAIKVNVIPANLQALAGIDPIKVEACIGQSASLKAININNLPNVGYRWIVNGTQLPTDTNQTLILFPGLPVNTVRAIVFSRLTSSCITKQSDTSDVQLVKQIEAITLTRTLIQTAPAAGQIICPNTPVSFGIQTNLKGKVDFKVQWWRNDTLVGTTVDTFFTFNSLPNGAKIQAVSIFDTTLTCVTSNFGKGKDSTTTQIINVLPAGDIRCLPCALVLNVTPTNINCAGGATGSIQAQVTGGSGRYDYSLLPNGPANQSFPFFFGLAPGTYSVSVRDSVTNCTKTVSGLNIVAVNAYNVFVSAVNPTPCVAQADGKLEFVTVTDASGDVNKYKFRIRSTDPYSTNRLFTGLPAGTYIMEVIDTITGCFTQNVRTLTAPAALQAQVSITALPSCYGQFNGQIQLDTVINGSGFYQYSLSGDSGTYASVGIKNPIPQGFGAGQFQLFFKDLQTGCLDTALVNITQPDSLKLSATVLINSQCSVPTGQIKLLEFSGGTGGKKLEVKLPNASVFLPVEVSADSILLNLAGGDYVFQLTDTNNCSKQFILNLPNNNPRAQQITVVKPCIGDTNGIIRLSGLVGGNKPYTFTLNNSQGDLLKVQTDSVFSQLKPGTYGITLTDASNPGCEVKYVREVSEATKVKFTIAGITPSTCENFDGKIKFTLSGGQPGFKYAFDSLPGVFTSFKALVGDTLMLSGLSKRADGNPYTLRLTDSGPGAGCTADTTFNIPGNSPLRFKFALRNVKCFGENSGAVLIDSLNGTGPVTLKVVDVTSGALVKEDSIPGNLFLNNQFVLGGLPAGQFNLVVQQYGECQASRTFPFALSQPTQINISARPYKPSAEGFAQGSILLDTVKGSAAPYLVLFNEGSYFSYKPDTLFDNLNPGKYTITVQDSIGCEVSKELEVVNDTQLFIPTLFTPNGDGLNDLLIIKNLPAGSSLNIRNRWGEEVLNANPYNNDWDAKGLQDGTYFYIIKIPNLESQNGWMEIKR